MINDLIIREDFNNEFARSFVQKFENTDCKKYIFGRNEFAESLIDNFEINGVVDNFTKDKEFKGIPIIKLSEIPANSLVVVVVVVGKPIIAEKIVSQYQFDFLDYYLFLKYARTSLKEMHFISGSKEDISNNFDEYSKVYGALADEISKNQLYNILNFRYSFNLRFMRGFDFIVEKQYFEDFIHFEKNEVFVDAGAFDGTTTLDFIANANEWSEIHIFEPQANQMDIIKQKLKEYSKIYYYNAGLYSEKATLSFNISDSASGICENGEALVDVLDLDSIVNLEPTYIKMDIEGAELSAIDGSKNIILKHHPKLAICVYHKADDIHVIYNKIMSIRTDYEVYLRHYTQGIYETVMYFVPKKTLRNNINQKG